MNITIELGTIVKIDGQPRRLGGNLIVVDVPEDFLDSQDIMEEQVDIINGCGIMNFICGSSSEALKINYSSLFNF